MEGVFYFAINYPSFLQLKENSRYFLRWNAVDYFALIYAHRLPVEVLDFSNSINHIKIDDQTSKFEYANTTLKIPDDNLSIGLDPLITIVDTKSDSIIRTRRFTKLVFGIECTIEYDKEKASKDTDNILEHFIHLYKLATGDSWVVSPGNIDLDVLVGKEGFHPYTDEEKRLTLHERLLSDRGVNMGVRFVRTPHLFKQVPNDLTKIDEFTNKLTKYVERPPQISMEQELYLKAMDEFFLRNNFKYSVHELFLIVEIVTGRVMNDLKKNRGISNKKLKNFERDISISYLLNIELPMIFNFTTEQKEVIHQVDMLRLLRNKIVHDNYQVKEEEVKPYFKIVGSFTRVIHQVHQMNVNEAIHNELIQASIRNAVAAEDKKTGK